MSTAGRCAVMLWLMAGNAVAHTSGTSFLALRAESSIVHAEWDFDVRDLNQLLQLDRDVDGAVTWGEITSARAAIEALVLSRTHLATASDRCTLTGSDAPAIAEHGDGPYLRLIFTFACPGGGALTLDDAGWFAFDPGHRALLEYEAPDGSHSQAILSKSGTQWHASESRGSSLRRFFVEGARHLVTGYDHLAFLGVLLLALARRRESGAAPALGGMLRSACAVITAFTVAHSLTLGLAATGHVRLPQQPVEIAIAASVMLAALLNLPRRMAHHGWKLAFGFGLVHGLGFAGALAELTGGSIDLLALAAFNVGIEAAQMALAAAAVPLIWWAFRGVRSERIGLPIASGCVACLAGVWVLARTMAGLS